MSLTRAALRTAAPGLALAAVAAGALALPDAAIAGPPTGFSLEPVATGFDQPTAFAHAPDGRIFVAEKTGVVKVVRGGETRTFLDLRDRTNEFWNRGLIGLALDPDFAANGRVYLAFSEELTPAEPDGPPPAGGTIIRIAASAADPDVADPATEVTLLDGFRSVHYSHSVGALEFDGAGRLVAALGDGASFFEVDPFALESLSLDSLQGKIVRLDPATGHGVPENPHFDAGDPASPRSRIIAWGLRNPYRFSIDRATGDIWVGDVGWTSRDELNHLPAAPGTDAARNFGWPCSEGSAPQDQYPEWFPTQCGALLAGGWTRPAHEWRTGATASTGGPRYRGAAYPETYRGRIFFADFSSDQMMTFDPATGSAEDFGGPEGWGGPVDIRVGPDDHLHVLGFLDGTLRRLVHTGEAAPQSATPSAPRGATPGPAWPAPTRASAPAAAARFPDLAVNRRGQAVAAWVERIGGRTRVVAMLRRRGGAWSRPRPISDAGRGGRDPSVAIGEGGHAVVTWRQPAGRVRTAAGTLVARYTIVARRVHARGRRWQRATDLGTPGSAGRPFAAVDRRGTAFATWRTRHRGTFSIMGAVGRPGRGRPVVRRIDAPRGCAAAGPPDVVADPGGRALAWWACGDSALAVSDRRPGTGAFARARATEVPGRGALDAGFTLGRDGAAFGAAARTHGRSPVHALARPTPRDPVVRAADLSDDGGGVSMAEHGEDSLVAWRRRAASGGVRVAVAGRSGAPSGQSTFDAGRRVSPPTTDLGPEGIGAVVWVRGRGARAAMMVAVRTGRGVAWARPTTLARGRVDGSRPPVVAVDGRGRITAIWSRKVGKRYAVERADLPRAAVTQAAG